MGEKAERKIIAKGMKSLSNTQFLHIINSARPHGQYYGEYRNELRSAVYPQGNETPWRDNMQIHIVT